MIVVIVILSEWTSEWICVTEKIRPFQGPQSQTHDKIAKPASLESKTQG